VATARVRRVAVVAIAILYGIALLLILFWPQHVDGPHGENAQWAVDLITGFTGVSERIAYRLLEKGANVLLFVPAGAILSAFAGFRFRWWVPVLGLLGSASVELLQGTLLPGRTADWRDIVANTSGVIVGGLLGAAFGAIRRRALRSRAEPAAAPRVQPGR
jgi:glycopeptide antibiotics resistance protein